MNEFPQPPPSQSNQQVKFVYLQSNKQKVTNLISSYNRSTVFALIFSIFFSAYQLQKHLVIYFKPYYQPEVVGPKRQLQYHSLNLHSFYAFMTLKVVLVILYKAWKIRRQNRFGQYNLEVFRKQYTQVEDYVYFNLLLVCLTLVRLFQAGFLPVWFDFVGSAVGISLGKLLQKERAEILHYSTQLRQQTLD